jgi:hydrogenase/urease accessory protein HupE
VPKEYKEGMVVTAAVVGNQFVGLLSDSICVQLPAPEDPILKDIALALE